MERSIVILCFILYACTLCAQSELQDMTGSQAKEFELTDIHGNLISSENTKGKVVVLNFWFIGCKPCLEEIPALNEVYERYADNPDVVFVSITTDKLKRVKKKMSLYNIDYPIVSDGEDACKLFEANGFPTNIVIDKEGKYSFRFTGGFTGIGRLVSKAIQKALEA